MKTEKELADIKAELIEKGIRPIYTFPVELDDEGLKGTFYFKKPNRMELAAIQKGATGADSLRATEIFIINCFIGGDDKLLLDAQNLDIIKQVESGMLEVVKTKSIDIKKN